MKPSEQTTPTAFPALTACLPWHLRFLSPASYQHGGECGFCKREIAAPKGARRPSCLYCAMERGAVTMDDAGPYPPCYEDRTFDLLGVLA